MVRSHINLSDAFDGFILACQADGQSDNTIAIYRQHKRLMLLHLGNVPVENIVAEDLQHFMVWLRTDYKTKTGRPYSQKSLSNVWCTLRSFFKWSDNILHTGRPDIDMKQPEVRQEEIVPYTEDEVSRLFTATEKMKIANPKDGRASYTMQRATADRDELILILLLDTGMRASELCRIRIEDIDIQNNMIWLVPQGSGRKSKGRPVVIGKKTRALLWKYINTYNPAPLLLYSREGEPYNRFSLAHLLTRLGERAGVNNTHAHRFRHTFAIEYLRNSGDIFTLQSILGHASLKMVRNYLKLAQTDIATAHRRASPADKWYKK